MPNPFVTGSTCYLRAIDKDDVDRLLRWINDPDVTQYLYAGRFPLSRAQEEQWVDNLYKSKEDVVLGICTPDGRHVGSCGLHGINPFDRHAVVGILIGEKELWGKGIGTEAMRLMVGYAFDSLNLNRVELSVYSNNPRAQRSYEKVGFKVEGCLRQKRYKNGRYLDEVVMSILREEWKPLRA